jgi:O-antigen/teichoic acid export membrane protein
LVQLFSKNKSLSDSRGQSRIKRAASSSLLSLINRLLAAVTGLVTIPILAQNLGEERFGLWLTLGMLLQWVIIADLGIANSLVNAVAIADGKDDTKEAQEIVSSGFFLTVIISVAIFLGFLALFPFVSWQSVFNVKSAIAIQDINGAVWVCGLIFFLKLLTSIPKRIYYAYQEGYLYELWDIISSIISVVGLIIAIQQSLGLPVLLGIFFGSRLLSDFIATFHIFLFHKRWLFPSVKHIRLVKAKWLMNTGFKFWFAQIASIVLFQTDLIIVAQLFGAAEVASYGVVLKLFSYVGTISYSLVSPLWPAYSEALSRGDINWISKTFKRTITLSLAWAVPLCVLLLAFSGKIIEVWVSPNAVPTSSLLWAMFFATIFTVIAHCVGILVNGLCDMTAAVWFGCGQGIVNIFLSIFLAKWIGVAGVAWSTAICLCIFSIVLMGNRIVRQLRLLSLAQ